jgi:hypothetical protein
MRERSTSISEKEALVICLPFRLSDAVSFFFDLIELDNTQAVCILEMFLSNLHSNGFEDEFLLQNWISFGCDGASNVLGRHAGVVRHLV